ncbi:MAG TPA: hypothetical protein VHU80_24800 [Polyangiaceae bacterium]|jgi:hypothetical protein|nr:hypothetical protein [Polyangiaceae bacterium]
MAGPPGGTKLHDAVPLRASNGVRIVGARTVSAAVAIASAVFGRDGQPPPAERLTYLEREIEDFLARSGPRARTMLSFMIWVVALVGPWLVGKLGPLGRLSQKERVRALSRLERRFGEPLIAVKAILCLLYYEHPDAARDVGFDGECHLPRGAA